MRLVEVFEPRYKRLTKEMFPDNAYEGLNIAKANKLLIYAIKKPEKWIRILLLLNKRLQEFAIRDEQEYVQMTLLVINWVLFIRAMYKI